jgi:hypothetical protein
MEAVQSSRFSVNFYCTRQCHIAEDNTLHDFKHCAYYLEHRGLFLIKQPENYFIAC